MSNTFQSSYNSSTGSSVYSVVVINNSTTMTHTSNTTVSGNMITHGTQTNYIEAQLDELSRAHHTNLQSINQQQLQFQAPVAMQAYTTPPQVPIAPLGMPSLQFFNSQVLQLHPLFGVSHANSDRH